jgi:hypothetical protein
MNKRNTVTGILTDREAANIINDAQAAGFSKAEIGEILQSEEEFQSRQIADDLTTERFVTRRKARRGNTYRVNRSRSRRRMG